jgi:hypothetical protein
MTDNYYLLVYYVHSYLESVKAELIFNKKTTVENFRLNKENDRHCNLIFDYCLTQWNYELSYNQVANGINLFLKAHKND